MELLDLWMYNFWLFSLLKISAGQPTHNMEVCHKLSKIIYLIQFLGDTAGQTVLIDVYYAKFESVLKYGNTFWGGVHKDFKNLFKLQKKCVRVIKGGNK
jgi:hypothetical protein